MMPENMDSVKVIKPGLMHRFLHHLELLRPGFTLLILAVFGFLFWSAVITGFFYLYFKDFMTT